MGINTCDSSDTQAGSYTKVRAILWILNVANTAAQPNRTALQLPRRKVKVAAAILEPIAGGVVGGVVGLLLIAALAWYCIRRRRLTSTQERSAPGYEYSKPELDRGAAVKQGQRPHELDPASLRRPVEMDASQRYEMYSEHRHEM